jgi:hypothetical protein
MSDLIRPDRATQSATLAALAASSPAYLASLITAASDLIRRYCARDFAATTYSEYRDGGVYGRRAPLLTRQFPVTEILRIATCPIQAVLVSNSGGVTAQRATVETIADGTGINTASVKLAWVSSGVAGSAMISAATYPTLQSLVSQIAAVGGANGFSASIYQSAANVQTGLIATADLRPLQGASNCIGAGAYLGVWTEQLSNYGWGEWDGAEGYCPAASGYLLDPETGEIWGRFPRGPQAVRIDYVAGFATVPQPVQEACVQLVQWLFQQSQTNSAVKSAKLGNTSIENSEKRYLPPAVMQLLGPYIAHDRIINR